MRKEPGCVWTLFVAVLFFAIGIAMGIGAAYEVSEKSPVPLECRETDRVETFITVDNVNTREVVITITCTGG